MDTKIDLIKIVQKKNNNNNDNNFSNISLKENDNNNFAFIHKFRNNSFDLEKGTKLQKERDKEKEKKEKISNRNYINSICVSKKSIIKIIHRKQRESEIFNEKNKNRKYFSFLDFLKSFFFKQDKGSHHFLTLFREHLLSEEHLLKSHINRVLLEKKYKIFNEENTNIYECYKEL